MRTGPRITPAIRLASHQARPGITAHLRLVSLFPGPGRAPAGYAARLGPRRSRLGGRTAGTEVARAPAPPGPRGPGTMPPPASELELNAFISQRRQKCHKTDVSQDGRPGRQYWGVACNPIWDTMTFATAGGNSLPRNCEKQFRPARISGRRHARAVGRAYRAA